MAGRDVAIQDICESQENVDEIEALCSIYGNEWQIEDEANCSYSIRIEDATLYVTLPSDYPSISPPQYQLSAPYLGFIEKQRIASELDQVYLENIGETVIFQWVEKIRELLQEMQLLKEEEEKVEVPLECYVEPLEMTQLCRSTLEITHGAPITDRKSIFQGHAAVVFDTKQVIQVLEQLKENRKISNATHNMYAYRIYKEDTRSYLQDCDDDGEAHAGGRLLHLLQILGIHNAVVVVTRWYGGVLLGPDRFRHINNAARQVLEKAGLIVPNNNENKKK